jgi:hypothetical protein
MARIILPTSPIISRNLIVMTQMAIGLRDLAERTKDIADEITGGGVTKAALETAPEVIGGGAALQAGNGAVVYDAITTIINAVGPSAASVKAIIKTFDQG